MFGNRPGDAEAIDVAVPRPISSRTTSSLTLHPQESARFLHLDLKSTGRARCCRDAPPRRKADRSSDFASRRRHERARLREQAEQRDLPAVCDFRPCSGP